MLFVIYLFLLLLRSPYKERCQPALGSHVSVEVISESGFELDRNLRAYLRQVCYLSLHRLGYCVYLALCQRCNQDILKNCLLLTAEDHP